jgi:hypothetical protein
MAVEVALYEGDEDLEVVGESRYQEALARTVQEIGTEVPAILVPEPENPHDPNAVAIWVAGGRVGYLRRDVAAEYHGAVVRLMKQQGNPIALMGRIVGGGDLSYGIWLRHDPSDFGVEPASPPPARSQDSGAGVRSGLSEARLTDDEDEDYDIGFLDDLPEDPIRRIPRLRELLANETAPIERHYLFALLEEALHKCRKTFPTALDEYDQVTEQHHTEINDSIRAALVAKFGGVPVLDTYRQATIRHKKNNDPEAALKWAERGVAVYGGEALRSEAVTDLQARAARLKGTLD